MLALHPVIRLLSTAILLAAVFLAASVQSIAAVYGAIVLLIAATRLLSLHLRFTFVVMVPLLLALLLIWHFAVDAAQIPVPHGSGIEYAAFLWLRVVAAGAVFQWLFSPLVAEPLHLRAFLHRTGLGGGMGTLIITSIVFLPEVRRRIGQLLDARMAQGEKIGGWRGFMAMPTLLTPLIASLLDSAMQRSELWSHRGILERATASRFLMRYSALLSVLGLAYAGGVLALAVLGWTWLT